MSEPVLNQQIVGTNMELLGTTIVETGMFVGNSFRVLANFDNEESTQTNIELEVE